MRPLFASLLYALAGLFLAAGPVLAQTPQQVLEQGLAGAPGGSLIVIEDFAAGPEAVAGLRRLGETDAVQPEDRWHLGSNGKAITATAIARLVEQGYLDWNTPLEAMLPDMAGDMDPAYRDVTLLELLSHRAGLPENTSDMALFEALYDDPSTPTEQRRRYLTQALAEPPVGPARGAPAYSNTGYLVAAYAAEVATGRPFEDILRVEVFEPLGMSSVAFDQLGRAGEPSGHVEGRVSGPRDANPAMFVPAGGMRMSMTDWARFAIDQMRGERGEGRLLRADTYRLLHTGQGGTRNALGWGAAPSVMGRSGPALTHTGSDGNWFAVILLFPEAGDGLLVALNAAESMGADAAALAIARTLVGRLGADPAP